MYLPMTEMAEEKWIEDLATRGTAGTDVTFVVEMIDSNSSTTVGIIGLTRISIKDHSALFGIAIGEKGYWSKGYGTEATRLILDYGFRQLNLHRIWSGALAFNERSIRLHKTAGFQEEGRLREAMFQNGEFHDMVMFGLLREEWKQLK
jgi:diamine N-acetyltransferase